MFKSFHVCVPTLCIVCLGKSVFAFSLAVWRFSHEITSVNIALSCSHYVSESPSFEADILNIHTHRKMRATQGPPNFCFLSVAVKLMLQLLEILLKLRWYIKVAYVNG